MTVVTQVVLVTMMVAFLALPDGVHADQHEMESDGPMSLEEAIFGGEVKFNLRVRAEIADIAGSDTSVAITERIRLGYGSKAYNGWSFYVEMEDIRTLDDDRYRVTATGGGNPKKTNIADPEDTELNQGYLKYDWKDAATQIIVGRQRIILDDARFVGNVGWRQNEQTYDAATVVSKLNEDTTLVYSFLWDINRIFGPDADNDFNSESHAINLSYDGLSIGKVTAFAYLLDVDGFEPIAAPLTSALASSDTFGIRLAGKEGLNSDLSLAYVFSYAHQVDAGDNPTDYGADYYLAECKLVHRAGFFGAGYEVLGSDNKGTVAFATPLATGHKFNGWADSFLTTPVKGLTDAYLMAGTKLPGGIDGKIIYHWFWTEEGGGDLGDEIDVVLKKSLNKQFTAVAKYARFNGVSTTTDKDKFWLQFEYKF